MVRAIVFVSAVLAMVAYVSAAPHGSVANVEAPVKIGDVNAQNVAKDVVNADNLNVDDVLQCISKSSFRYICLQHLINYCII